MRDCYEKLRKIRKEKKLTYESMSKQLGISRCYYWQLENKQRRLYYEMAIKIATIFKKKPDDLFY